MMRKHTWLRTAVIVAANLALLIGSSAQGMLWLGQTTAHAAPAPPSAQGSGRFAPDIHAPPLPTTAWHPHDPGHPGHPAPAKKGAAATNGAPSPVGRHPGEQADLRTAATSTYLNADGTWMLKAYSAPVHYQDASGAWQNIDDTITGDTSDAGYTYGNAANSWHVHFARTAGGPKLIHVTYPDLNVAETLDGAASSAAATSGAVVTYAAVFPGVDLEYQVLNARLEEMLLLHDAQGPASYSFTFHVPG